MVVVVVVVVELVVEEEEEEEQKEEGIRRAFSVEGGTGLARSRLRYSGRPRPGGRPQRCQSGPSQAEEATAGLFGQALRCCLGLGLVPTQGCRRSVMGEGGAQVRREATLQGNFGRGTGQLLRSSGGALGRHCPWERPLVGVGGRPARCQRAARAFRDRP